MNSERKPLYDLIGLLQTDAAIIYGYSTNIIFWVLVGIEHIILKQWDKYFKNNNLMHMQNYFDTSTGLAWENKEC